MAHKKRIGISFGVNSISVVESDKRAIANYFDTPHSLFDSSKQPAGQDSAYDVKLIALLQKSLRDKKINEVEVNLSLPIRDIILRSFFVPWVAPNELKGVVEFEARRYIPFKIEELTYNYYGSSIAEKGGRRYRILFAAIRKATLERYTSILDQAGLKVTFTEPSAVSLLRLLAFKKHLQRRQKIAVLQTTKTDGTIMIIDDYMPNFVREFQLVGPMTENIPVEPETTHNRLLSEMRISLDYYRRQHAPGQIEKLLLISTQQSTQISELIQQNLQIPSTTVAARTLHSLEEEVGAGVLNAFGAALHENVSFPINVNLTKPQTKAAAAGEGALEIVASDFTSTKKVAIVCAVIILLVFLIAKLSVAASEHKISSLTKQQGVYEGLTIEAIDQKRQELIDKLNRYKEVPRSSNIAFFLSRIPNLLPEGAWLTKLSIHSSSGLFQEEKSGEMLKRVSINMSGYVFSQEIAHQVEILNELVAQLKKEKSFASWFSEITINQVSRQPLGNHTATYFEITCQ